jgi:hypothetical protein
MSLAPCGGFNAGAPADLVTHYPDVIDDLNHRLGLL